MRCLGVALPAGCRICASLLTKATRVPICEECIASLKRIGLVCDKCGRRLKRRREFLAQLREYWG